MYCVCIDLLSLGCPCSMSSYWFAFVSLRCACSCAVSSVYQSAHTPQGGRAEECILDKRAFAAIVQNPRCVLVFPYMSRVCPRGVRAVVLFRSVGVCGRLKLSLALLVCSRLGHEIAISGSGFVNPSCLVMSRQSSHSLK